MKSQGKIQILSTPIQKKETLKTHTTLQVGTLNENSPNVSNRDRSDSPEGKAVKPTKKGFVEGETQYQRLVLKIKEHQEMINTGFSADTIRNNQSTTGTFDSKSKAKYFDMDALNDSM